MSEMTYLNDDNFTTTIANGVTLVDFYADWCGPCRMIAPLVEQLAQEMKGKATIAKMDVDAAQKTTATFSVTSIPTIIVFKDGKEFKRVVGVRDLASLKSLIQSAIDG